MGKKDVTDAYMKGEIWSPMICVDCEMLIAFDINMVPDDIIRKPEWHLHAGGGLCVLCCLERRMAKEGIADLDDPRALDILDDIIDGCLH